jgi:MFS family permease
MIFFSGVTLGIITAALQNATPPRMRGVAASLFTFSVQLIGYMIGPTVIALITDRVFEDPTMVGHSMQIVMSIASVTAGVMLFTVLRHYRAIVIEIGQVAGPAVAARK